MTADWDAALAEGERLRDAALALAAGKNHNGFSLVEFNNWLDDNAENLLSAALRERESAKDARRILFIRDLMDGIGDIDFHEEATINASAFGRDEANDNDYIAAIRTAIDAAIAAEKGEQT